MYKIVVFLMLFSYCVARSISDGRDVVDTPAESLSADTGDIKSTDNVADINPVSETKTTDVVADDNPAQIETENDDAMDLPVNDGDNTRFWFSTPSTRAPVRPFTQQKRLATMSSVIRDYKTNKQ